MCHVRAYVCVMFPECDQQEIFLLSSDLYFFFPRMEGQTLHYSSTETVILPSKFRFKAES